MYSRGSIMSNEKAQKYNKTSSTLLIFFVLSLFVGISSLLLSILMMSNDLIVAIVSFAIMAICAILSPIFYSLSVRFGRKAKIEEGCYTSLAEAEAYEAQKRKDKTRLLKQDVQ